MDGMATVDVARITGPLLGMLEKHYGHLMMKERRQRMLMLMKGARERLNAVNLL